MAKKRSSKSDLKVLRAVKEFLSNSRNVVGNDSMDLKIIAWRYNGSLKHDIVSSEYKNL